MLSPEVSGSLDLGWLHGLGFIGVQHGGVAVQISVLRWIDAFRADGRAHSMVSQSNKCISVYFLSLRGVFDGGNVEDAGLVLLAPFS